MKSLVLILLQLGASGGDAYFTNQALSSHRYYERNPLAAPFVQTTSARVAYFSIGAASKIAIPVVLRKHRHKHLADAAAIFGIADNASGAIYGGAF